MTCVSFSHDGHCILVSTLDNKLLLLDKDNGDLLNRLAHVNGHCCHSGLQYSLRLVVVGIYVFDYSYLVYNSSSLIFNDFVRPLLMDTGSNPI